MVGQSTLQMSVDINDGKWGFNFTVFDMGISCDTFIYVYGYFGHFGYVHGIL